MVWEDLEYKSSKIRACFETPPHPPHSSPKSSQIRSSSLRACRLQRGQPRMATNRALVDPRKPSSSPAVAQRRPQMDLRCPRDGLERALEGAPGTLQRGHWSAKLRAGEITKMQLRHLGASWSTLSPRGRFEAILGPHVGAIFGSSWGPKSDLKKQSFSNRFGLRFGVQNVPQNGPDSSQDGLPTPKSVQR